MSERAIRISQEVYLTLHLRQEVGESYDGLLRRLLGLDPRVKRRAGRPASVDGRKKYFIADMQRGDELVFPWNRDEHGNIGAEFRGLNASINRCNRLPGRKYKAFPTTTGLQVVRIE
jgi:hypothetical protein